MRILTPLLALALLCCPVRGQTESLRIIDAVVASVDGQPITLQELGRSLQPPRTLTMADASNSADARAALDRLILERLILAEGESKKMQVSDAEVDSYINEVAKRNNLSRPDFETALQKEGVQLGKYKQDIKLEILKSRLASTFVRGNVNVSDEEIEKYLEEHVGRSKTSNQIQLRQIQVSASGRSMEEAKEIAEAAKKELDGGADFAEVAKKYSDSPDKADGGLLGVVEEKDLSPEIFDIVFPLKEGEVSKVAETGDSYRIFRMEKRFGAGEARDERLVEEVRAELTRAKMEEKFNSFFMTDLYKQHSVDKKI